MDTALLAFLRVPGRLAIPDQVDLQNSLEVESPHPHLSVQVSHSQSFQLKEAFERR
jgi:hypothetical protein